MRSFQPFLFLMFLVVAAGCAKTPQTASRHTLFEHAIVAGKETPVLMTESGEGTEQSPLGVDFKFEELQ